MGWDLRSPTRWRGLSGPRKVISLRLDSLLPSPVRMALRPSQSSEPGYWSGAAGVSAREWLDHTPAPCLFTAFTRYT